MDSTVPVAPHNLHRVIPETRPRMASADLRKAEIADLKAAIGACIERARQRRGWTLDELANALPAPDGADRRDPRQVQRWINATAERPQFDVLFACVDDEFTAALFEELAPLSRRYQQVSGLRRLA